MTDGTLKRQMLRQGVYQSKHVNDETNCEMAKPKRRIKITKCSGQLYIWFISSEMNMICSNESGAKVAPSVAEGWFN